jgi:phospholipid/cholesterol/gamma-HCH transport system substrate-binding protein
VNYTLVGAFVLALGAALIAVVLWLASGGLWQKKFDIYLAIEEESVAGLNLNAPVKYNGVEIGKVKFIELDPLNPQLVNLYLAIERGSPVKQDTVAVLKTQGLTGIAYVELSGGALDAPLLRTLEGAKFPVIATKASLSARLENVLTRVLAKLDSTSSNINAILSETNQRAFSSALADLAVVTHTFAARKDTIDGAIAHAGQTLDNAARASAQMAPALERVGRGADALQRMGDSVTQTSQGAGETVNAVGADVKRFTADALPELERLMSELNVLSSSLRRLSDQTQHDPASLLRGQAVVRPGPGESATEEAKP